MKYWLTTSVVLVVLLGVATAGCTPVASVFTTPATPAAVSSGSTTGRPTPPRASSSGMFRGQIVPARYVRLVFGTSGVVARILVKKGQRVKAGDTLAELDMRDLNLRVQAAEDAVNVAKATLAQVGASATKEELAAAQAVYESSAAQLAKLQRGPTREELATLKANLEKAQAQRDQAQAAYDRAGGSTNPYIGMLPVSLQLQQATLECEIAQANYDKAIAPDVVGLAQAKAQLAQAEAALMLKKNGPKPEDIALSSARVRQAETALEQAQLELSKARLSAPMDGEITDVLLRQGEAIQAGGLAAIVADLSDLRVETTELDEFGVTGVQVGQSVSITVDALPERVLSGKVIDIVPPQVPLKPDNNPFYVATIALVEQDPALRYGMTVRVDFSDQ